MFSRIEQKTGTIISNGRMDQYLYPFYVKDIADGRLTAEESDRAAGVHVGCDGAICRSLHFAGRRRHQ